MKGLILIIIVSILIFGCNQKNGETDKDENIIADNEIPENNNSNVKKAPFRVIESYDTTKLIKWTSEGIYIELPKDWAVRSSYFGDSIKRKKLGELSPGLVTPKDHNLNGSEFIEKFKNYGDIDFEEIHFTMDGLPSTIMHTDSFKLKNGNWYLGVSESEYEGQDYGIWYSYLYFGDFEKKKVLIQLYRYNFDLADTNRLNRIIETIKEIN